MRGFHQGRLLTDRANARPGVYKGRMDFEKLNPAEVVGRSQVQDMLL